ncbi:hypothetical protein IZ6_24170 [Terrihabitans soli]|uniref:YjiS-like domain-containing protein n=1 Tax=Terrihabitans soli TaxID=708113 RepID=A0A6S6QWR4_9HYPH|nr:DUF1127 domain-containing protein [Terrihabitans soli]BCJ91682.1 hypothetical protein IZ6_24170 [Terrihabitans soli]
MAQYLPKEAGSLSPATSLFFDLGLAVLAAVSAVVNRYQAARSLSQFDSRMLADIGLTPGDVDSAFAEPIWKDPTRRLAVIAVERRAAARALRLGRIHNHQKAEAELVN